MSEQRFRLDYEEDDAIFIVEDDDIVYPIRNDTIKEYQLQKLVDKLNEQQATIKQLKEENSNLNSVLNEVGLQKPFIKILDDYMIEYDGSCFSMHKPSDIRSFVYLMNRNNNFDELQCEYNDESMVIDDE